SRFSAGLPLLIPTDRAAPSYQLLVLSLASLAFVLFVAITDVLTFGARTEVRSFLDINIRLPLDKRTPAFFAMPNVTGRSRWQWNAGVKVVAGIGLVASDSRGEVR